MMRAPFRRDAWPDDLAPACGGESRGMNTAAEPTAGLDIALAHASRLLATDPVLAGEQAMEIIKTVGEHPAALLVLGVSRRARGDLEGALQILQPLAANQPNSALAQLELGIALGRASQGDAAALALRRAVTLKPDLPQAWRALGDHLMAMDDAEGADLAYANHIRFSTRDPQLLGAATALCENRIPEAEALLREQLKRAPTDVAAIRMLAEVAARLGRNDDAENLLARCLELAPGFHAARQNYALVLHRSNKPDAAHWSRSMHLLAVEPDNPGYRNLKAVVLCRIGDYEPAIQLYDGILKAYPRQREAVDELRPCAEDRRPPGQGDRGLPSQPAAGSGLRRSVVEPGQPEDRPLQRGRPGRHAARTRQARHRRRGPAASRVRHRQGAGRWRRLRGLVPPLPARQPVAPRRTCATTPTTPPPRVARIKRSYTREFFGQRGDSGADAPDPIFIVGLPRAGSTLLEQILSSHSAVEGTMELPDIISITRDLRSQGDAGQAMPYHDVLAESLDAAGLARARRALPGSTRASSARPVRRSSSTRCRTTSLHVGLIQLILPNAKIIDARRHPLACCFSGFKQHFARGQSFTYDLDDIGRYYRDYVELMAHFDQVLPGRVHRVIYERMVDDTETEVRRLLDYCGLPFEDGCLRFFENARAGAHRQFRTGAQADLPRRRGPLAPFRTLAGSAEAGAGPGARTPIRQYPDSEERIGHVL